MNRVAGRPTAFQPVDFIASSALLQPHTKKRSYLATGFGVGNANSRVLLATSHEGAGAVHAK